MRRANAWVSISVQASMGVPSRFSQACQSLGVQFDYTLRVCISAVVLMMRVGDWVNSEKVQKWHSKKTLHPAKGARGRLLHFHCLSRSCAAPLGMQAMKGIWPDGLKFYV